ncbi:hypothetical protein INT48_006458 [Thamnidium elegans]|uniref:Uncharacterized protein n=1 Tax=Thamnidium elegans TaxID=101142 RepID=A0A8H7SRV7_9FUNG|nr:hypothetical protein INT48_006458 [Thamnidium elegans]
MSIDDIYMSDLSIEEEEETTSIYFSLMSKMRSEQDTVIEEEEDQRASGDYNNGIVKIKGDKEKKIYREYNGLQIEGFLNLLNNGISTTVAANQFVISKASAYRFRKQWMLNGSVVQEQML